MKLLITFVLNLIILGAPLPQTKINNLMNMSIYYESLCADSRRFITEQLYPAYKTIKNYFNIEFVPYGKATSKKRDGSWVFSCQHGHLECWGNKVQACALAQNAGRDAEMEFINCFMSKRTSEKLLYSCSAKTGFSVMNIVECVENGIGDELHAKYGAKTNQILPKVKYVPTIVFNDQYNASVDEKARVNLLAAIYRIFIQEKDISQGRRLSNGADFMEIPRYVKKPTRPFFYDLFGSPRDIMYPIPIIKGITNYQPFYRKQPYLYLY